MRIILRSLKFFAYKIGPHYILSGNKTHKYQSFLLLLVVGLGWVGYRGRTPLRVWITVKWSFSAKKNGERQGKTIWRWNYAPVAAPQKALWNLKMDVHQVPLGKLLKSTREAARRGQRREQRKQDSDGSVCRKGKEGKEEERCWSRILFLLRPIMLSYSGLPKP